MKFLGATDEARLADVVDALDRATVGAVSFPLGVRGLGAFPTPTRPRVIWAGIDDGREPLAVLANAVDRELAGLGVPREPRPFTAHVTLGRVREPRRRPGFGAALVPSERAFGTATVARLSLMRSDLSPRGARYSELAGFDLRR